MTLDRVSTAGGYPLTRIDWINATACCHSSACVRGRGVKKQESQRGGRKIKSTVSEPLRTGTIRFDFVQGTIIFESVQGTIIFEFEQEQSDASLYTAWPSGVGYALATQQHRAYTRGSVGHVSISGRFYLTGKYLN